MIDIDDEPPRKPSGLDFDSTFPMLIHARRQCGVCHLAKDKCGCCPTDDGPGQEITSSDY